MFDFSKLPKPAEKNISVRIKTAAERAVRKGHPWVFEDAILKQSQLGNAGDLAVIYDREKNGFLAVGLYDPLSPIRIKILQSLQPKRINSDFFAQQLSDAKAKRQPLISTETTGYRLVYGESDGFHLILSAGVAAPERESIPVGAKVRGNGVRRDFALRQLGALQPLGAGDLASQKQASSSQILDHFPEVAAEPRLRFSM